jgi:hypothetical protein
MSERRGLRVIQLQNTDVHPRGQIQQLRKRDTRLAVLCL